MGETRLREDLGSDASISSMLPDRMRHGHGEVRYQCGGYYVGQWQNDRRHGVGQMTYPCGDVYDGAWQRGMYHGRGTYRSPFRGGDEYQGEWQADKPHGCGWLRDSMDGVVYEGSWVHGFKEGKFREVHTNGCIVEGTYECDERTCLALSSSNFVAGIDECGERIRMFTATLTCERATHANLAECIYEGETIGADHSDSANLSAFTRMHLPGKVRHGSGRIKYECGNVYDGQWEHDKRSGTGTYWYACGDTYVGQWLCGMYHGKGKYTGSPNGGDSYDGEWKADQPHGHGRYTYGATGEVYEGQWKDGQYHGTGTHTSAAGALTEAEWTEGLLIPRWQLWQRETEEC